jgi:hypothetical protein
MEIVSNQVQYEDAKDIVYYPQEINHEDIVGDSDFILKVMLEFGYRIARGSAAGVNGESQFVLQERLFRKCLSDKEIHHVVEIGTWRGVSAAVLAHYVNKVTTVDIRYYDEAPRVWLWAGVQEKIEYVVVDDDRVKEAIISDLDFDFAFIDGEHSYDAVALDFELVKRCGRVLFHDYCPTCPGIVEFVNVLPSRSDYPWKAEISEPFAYAYWENGNNAS